MDDVSKTIMYQIQPKCDALYQRLKSEKDVQRKTNRGISEKTGVPISTVSRFFSGMVSNPGISMLAAFCIELGLSLDELMGIATPPEPQEENAVEITELKGRLARAEAEAALLRERSKLLEAGIAERKPMIYGLAGLCIFLSLVFVVYLFVDMSDTAHGFIQSNQVSPVLVVLILVIVALALGTAHSVAKRKAMIKEKTK